MAGASVMAVKEMTEISSLPTSMNGDPILYVSNLTAMMCGVVLGAYVFLWMIRDLVRDRKHAGFKSVLFNFRLMMGLCGLAAFMACLPETLYLQMYNDPKVSDATQAAVMTGKRFTDTVRIPVLMCWVGLLVMIYPYVGLALIDVDEQRGVSHHQVADYPGLSRLWKPLAVFSILALIAMAFAINKLYKG